MVRAATLFFLSFLSCAVFSQQEDAAKQPSEAEIQRYMEGVVQSLNYQTGTIMLGKGLATLTLPDTLRYLSPGDTEKVLVDLWGNPKDDLTLGMILPTNAGPADKDGWGVVITYDEDGYVSDEDADSIDYDELLKEIQAGTREANEERKKLGYGSIELVGWAEPPTYDKQAKKMFWAKELASENSGINTLNYNIRILGRGGVLVLNAVAGMDQINLVKTGMPAVIAATEFNPGNRYADYKPGSDKAAAYGLAALIGGGIAAKTGLFAKLLALLIAGKKIVIVLGALLIGGIAKLFGKSKQ